MPAEKLRLRPWLEREIDSGKTSGLSWIDRNKKIFKVPWKHASRHGWSLDRDACVFRAWAIHSGRFRNSVDKPDPRRWKANFRCALNALPDIREVPNQGISRGNHAFKVYQMIVKMAKKDNSKQPKCTIENRKTGKEHEEKKIKSLKEPVTKFAVKVQTAVPEVNYTYSPCRIPFDSNPFIGFWPAAYQTVPQLKDHDYLPSHWVEQRRELRDIGVLANLNVKQEPASPETRGRGCEEFSHTDDICDMQTLTIKDEDSVPNDEELIDLVDEMSSDSSSSSPFDDFGDIPNEDSPDSGVQFFSSPSSRRPNLHLDVKTERSEDYMVLPLTPTSTMEILKGIHTVPHGRLDSE